MVRIYLTSHEEGRVMLAAGAGVFGRRVVVKPFTAAGNSTRLLRPPTPVVAAFSFTTNRPNVLLSSSATTTTNQFQQCTSSHFSTSTANHHPPPANNNTTKTRKYATSNTGVIAKFKRMVRTLFGTEDDTPRGKQERKEMYWIVLLVAHQRLRVANQQQRRDQQQRRQQQHPTNGNSYAATGEEGWEMESKDRLKRLMDEAVTYLDTKTDITQMSLKRLRNEVQSYLRPQIVHLLTVARYVDNLAINNNTKEENNDSSNDDDDEDEDYYIFSTNEENMYKEILLYEYNHTCQLLLLLHDSSITTKDGSGRTPNPRPFYIMKKDAIETLLKHYNWWSTTTTTTTTTTTNNVNNNNENHSNNNDENDTEYIDPFGFVPNKATKDVVCAMRYYQTRNLIRSFMARRTQYYPPRDEKNKAVIRDTITQIIHQPTTTSILLPPPPPTRCYHTLLALKSTIPNNAGRGVYIDGFAPAGTLLAFIPGNVWTKEQLSNITTQTQGQLGHDPRHQLSMRYDDILIDSRHAPYTVINNLWSLGHIVNHPPPPTSNSFTETLLNSNTMRSEKCNNNIDDNDDDGKNVDIDNNKSQPTTTFHGPNCATVMINFTERMFDSDDNINNINNNDNSSKKLLHTYLPNMYEYPPTTPYAKNIFETENVIMHGMGLIAIRDVMDEELFYDYRLCPSSSSSSSSLDDNNNNGYPSWYHVWDEDALNKRWDTDDQ